MGIAFSVNVASLGALTLARLCWQEWLAHRPESVPE